VKHRELIFPLLVLAMTVLETAVLVLRGDDLKQYLGDDVRASPNLVDMELSKIDTVDDRDAHRSPG
jgi:hypothetical protein